MSNTKKIATVLCFVSALMFIFLGQGALSAQVIHHPSPSDSLSDRWDWAQNESTQLKSKQGFWVGYSIKRMMNEDYYIASSGQNSYYGSYPFSRSLRGEILNKILFGKDSKNTLSDEEQIRVAAKNALAGMDNPRKPQKKILKDVAILYKFAHGSSKSFETVRLNNLSVPFDTEELPMIWLGSADEKQSVSFLSRHYEIAQFENPKKRIISTIGFHGNSGIVVPFLEKVIKSNDSEELRGRAASELGDQESKKALDILTHTAKNDRSLLVRKRAVYGLEDLRLPGATDVLIDIARTSDSTDLRKRAISSLAEKASRKAVEAISDFAYKDENTDIQKRAVYALEDLSNNEGIPYLIEIAKSHPKSTIRKTAIYCLGDSGDQRALDTLVDIIKKK